MRFYRALGIVVLLLSTTVYAGDGVHLSDVKTEWQNLYGIILYSASARVENRSQKPIRFVKVKLELFDRHGTSVAVKEGYNLAAEALADDSVPGTFEEKLARVTLIPPGGADPVRLSLDKTDIPKAFRTAVVSIVEAK